MGLKVGLVTGNRIRCNNKPEAHFVASSLKTAKVKFFIQAR